VALAQLGAELLAASIAVHVSRIEEGDARVERGFERLAGGLGADVPPVGSQLPGAQADDRDITVKPIDSTLLHDLHPRSCAPQSAGRHNPRL
jgi:hypothetical protein